MGNLHLTGAFLFGTVWCFATHIFPGKRALVSYLLPGFGALDRWIRAKDYCCHEPGDGDGQKYRCLLAMGSSQCCQWFLEAIAPTDATAKAEYLSTLAGNPPAPASPTRRAKHATCGEEYKSSSNRARYCSPECRDAARRRQYRSSKRRKSSGGGIVDEMRVTTTVPQLDTVQTQC